MNQTASKPLLRLNPWMRAKLVVTKKTKSHAKVIFYFTHLRRRPH